MRWLVLLLALIAPALGSAQEYERNQCHDIWGPVGWPVSHKDPAALRLNIPEDVVVPAPEIACRDHYVAQYNFHTKNPDFVIERLNKTSTEGDNRRPHVSFKPDELLPSNAEGAQDVDYKHSGLARGHNAASADFKSDRYWMKATFRFSNAVPQVQNGFNGGTWKELEEHVQDLAKSIVDDDNWIYVITGPVDLPRDGEDIVISEDQNGCGQEIRLAGIGRLQDGKAAICNENDDDPSVECVHGVAVPSALFKIVYEPRMNRVFAFVMTNENHSPFKERGVSHTEYFERWRVSIDALEEVTNLDFFPGQTKRWRKIHEQACAETRWRR